MNKYAPSKRPSTTAGWKYILNERTDKVMSKKGTNIYKRKDGRWEGRYVKGRSPSGEIKYGYVYGKSYGEAREKQLQAQTLLSSEQTSQKQSKKTLEYFCKEWLVLNRNRVKRSTYVKYHNIVTSHIIPELGRCLPQSLDAVTIETFSSMLLSNGALHKKDTGLSSKTVRDILTVLNSILKYANSQLGNSLKQIQLMYPKARKKTTRVLSKEEQERFVQYLLTDMNDCKFGILLALQTGMRLGEVCALRWGNISMHDQTIRISDTIQRLQTFDSSSSNRTEVIFDDPKSETSKRIIPLSEPAIELCRQMNVTDRLAFVLTGTPDRYIEPRTMQYRLEKYTSECGLTDVSFHTLRHTFATRCVEVDFEIKSLSEILGHSSVQVTLDRYVHSSMELKRENMNKLPAIGFHK